MSNIAAVVRALDAWIDSFNFKRPGVEQSLGRDIADKAVKCIYDRSMDDRTGFGTAWPPNSEKPSRWAPQGYRQWKKDNYGIGEPNSRTGQMLSQESLFGRTTIEEKLITLKYGTDQPPTKAAFGSPTARQFAQDQKRTDTEKAYFAHTGQSRQQIVRPFYQLIDDDGDVLRELIVKNLSDYINMTNRAHGF